MAVVSHDGDTARRVSARSRLSLHLCGRPWHSNEWTETVCLPVPSARSKAVLGATSGTWPKLQGPQCRTHSGVNTPAAAVTVPLQHQATSQLMSTIAIFGKQLPA